jgi:uncharacterized protein YdcH (DUF465 family)
MYKQIMRLHECDIQRGNVIETACINAEFNQLIEAYNELEKRVSSLEKMTPPD